MENLPRKKKPTISLSLFTTLSDSFSYDKQSNSAKSPRNFEGGVVGLGIVAAMTDSCDTHEVFMSAKLAVSPRSTPIPIVSSAKPAANFKGGLNSERKEMEEEEEEVDELSESYTCVIAHVGNNLIRKRVYFHDKLNGVDDEFDVCMVNPGVFSASPAVSVVGELGSEFWEPDFLNSCFLCKKQLHGLDIFMYR